jgi:hypothetical protein
MSLKDKDRGCDRGKGSPGPWPSRSPRRSRANVKVGARSAVELEAVRARLSVETLWADFTDEKSQANP